MYCIKCCTDNTHNGPNCVKCGKWIGFVRDGRGFIPQLEYLEKDLKEGKITVDECGARLTRLETALVTMIAHMDNQGPQLLTLGFDETQQGTFTGFMAPARQGLEAMLRLIQDLNLDEDWPESIW